MRKIRLRLWSAVLSAAMLLCAAGCTPGAGPAEPSDSAVAVLTIGTADSGGTMYPVGSAIAEVLQREDRKINVSASSGSAMNAMDVVSGEVDLALVAGDTAQAVYEEEQGRGSSLRAVGAVFFSQSNWLTAEASGAEYVHDLKGLRLGIGPEYSTSELSALAALEGVGLDREETATENCGLGAGVDKVLRGELDAIHGFSGAPVSALAELAEKLPCRVLKYTPEELDNILAGNEAFAPAVLPAGTYRGQQEDVATFGVKCLLCVDESMDEELVYRLTGDLWNSRAELGAAHASMRAMEDGDFVREELPIPLHSGAERFYREIG